MNSVAHLLIRAPNWVGDLVMATPVLEAALADARFERVTIAVREHLADVLRGGPCEPHLLPIPGRSAEASLLRDARADAVMLLTSSVGAAWRSFRAGIPIRAGVDMGGRGLLLTHRAVPPTCDGRRAPIPTAHQLRDVAGLLGVQVPSLHPRLRVPADALAASRALLARLGLEPEAGYVACAPGAAFGAAKLWPPENHAVVLDALFERHGWRGVVTGGPGEEPAIEAVVGACRHAAISLADEQRDLVQLGALVKEARMLLVGDSGPRWYAAAFDVPCVTVMGPNFPELTATSLELCEVVRLEGLECAPCLRRRCPLEHHRCMLGIEPARVIEASERVLERAATGAARGPARASSPDSGGARPMGV